jgi:hypothetical protein
VAAVGTEVGEGIAIVGKALINMPRLTFDAIGYASSWGLNQIATDLYPLLIVAGVAMLIASFVISFVGDNIWPKAKARLALNANARLASMWNRFDRWNQSRKKVKEVRFQAATEVQIEAANALSAAPEPVAEPAIVPPPVIDAAPVEPGAGAAKASADGPAEPQQSQPESGGGVATLASANPTPEPIVPPEPAPGVMTQPEAEAYLGSQPNRAPTKAELRQMALEAEEERRKTRKPEPTDEPTRAQLLALASA